MRHGGRLAVGLTVCIGIAGVSFAVLYADFAPEAKTADDLGDKTDSEIEALPVPAEASLLEEEYGTPEPGEGLVNGRVYDVPGGFSRDDVEEWYEDRDIAGQPWREQWTWCPAPTVDAEAAAEGVAYFWVLPALDAVLSLEVDRDDRPASPAVGEVIIRMEIRELSGLPEEERPAC